jgi:hypothetical protein
MFKTININDSLIYVCFCYCRFTNNTLHGVTIRRHFNRIGGVMVSVLASSEVDRGFESRSGQTKDYEIGMCCFSAKHTALRSKSKDWLAGNQDNMFQWGDKSIHRLLFQ